MEKTSCYYGIVENKVSKEDFIRKSYVELYSAIDAPEGIDTVQFSDVFSETAELIKQYTTYDIDYTVEIGYNHTEQYIDQEKYYDHDRKEYLTRQVVKNRTVTNWQPYQGSAEKLQGIAVGRFNTGDNIDIGDKDEKISKQYGRYSFDVEKVLRDTEDRQATEEEAEQMTTPTKDVYLDLACTSADFYRKVSLPGDCHRNFRADWDATDMFACVYGVERYKLAFDYEGHKSFIKQFATEELPHIYCSYKHVDNVDEALKEEEKNCLNTNEQYQNNMKKGKILTWASIVLFFLSIGLFEKIGAISFLGNIAGIIGFVFACKFNKKVENQAKAIKEEHKAKRNNHKTEMQNKKMVLLETRFANMGWAPLTEAEKERFLPKNQHSLTDNYHGSNNDDDEYEEESEEELEKEPEISWEN